AAAERAAAGLIWLGVGEGVNVSWELPTWLESMVLVGALSRLGAVQNPMLPIYRAREVGFIVRQTRARLLVVPSVWKGFDFEAMANDVAGEGDGLGGLVCDRDVPEGDPPTLPTPPEVPDDTVALPERGQFYTSGNTAVP